MSRLAAILGVVRAPFLLLPVALVAAGACAGRIGGCFSWTATLLAGAGLLALHAAVNVLNEISDYRTGIDFDTRPTPFSGGSGTLPGGRLSPASASIVAVAATTVGASVGLYFLALYGTPFLPFLLAGAVCVLAYSNVFTRTGLGEVAAGLGLGGLPVLGTAFVQCGEIGPAAVAASIPAFFMTFDLLLLNEFPDEDADRAGGRRNLVLMLGRRAAARVYTGAALAVPGWLVMSVAIGWLPRAAAVAILPSLLLFRPLRWAVSHAEEEVPVPALAANVAWNLLTNIVLAFSLLAVSLP